MKGSRQRRITVAVVCVAAVASLGAAASNERFQVYSNERFGATADVPRTWKSDPPPENGDGLIFWSPDTTASITISGHLNLEDNPAEGLKDMAQPGSGETTTYRQLGRRSITLSGTKADMIFYRKSLLVCRDQIVEDLSIQYPIARKADYDALVTRVARSFHFSGQSWQIPNCR